MSHLLKYTEWQSANGQWHTGDTTRLAKGSNYWWHIPRMLNISLTDYILLLKDKFHATNFKFFPDNECLLLWDWQNYNDCHNFTLFVNREARNRKFFIC